MNRLAAMLIATAAVGWAGSALAADIPMKAPPRPLPVAPSWTGFYIGVNGGGVFGDTDVTHTGIPVGSVLASGDYTLDHHLSGWLAGGQIGYNWQIGSSWLWGLEADFDAADIHGDGSLSGPGVAQRNGAAAALGNFVNAHDKIDFFGTVRGRFGGLVTNDLLLYATGGLAYAHIKTSGQFHYAAPVVDYFASGSDTRVGWTVGGGLEFRVAPRWTIKAEYLYYDLGKSSITSDFGVPVTAPFQSRFDFNNRGNIVRAGINYQFTSGPGPYAGNY